MLVQVRTNNNVEGSAELAKQVEDEVTATLGRFAEQITRVEVHVNDENSHKQGIDKRCMMEARLAGLQPIAVHHDAATVEEAVSGAVDKLEKSLDRHLSKLGEHKGRTSFGGDQTI